MATRTQSRPLNSSRSSQSRIQQREEARSSNSSNSSSDRSAFSWGDNAGPLLGAALAGAAIGFAANYGRKALMQGMEAMPATGTKSSPPSMTWRLASSTRCWRRIRPRPSSARCC